MSLGLAEAIHGFFSEPPADCGRVTNECALQLELGFFLRLLGWTVEFEVPLRAPRLEGSTLRPKFNLDLLASKNGERVGFEIKVPLHGRHPETIYDFCADIEFVEALRRTGSISIGYCVFATNDRVFWTDSGRGSPLHDRFRSVSGALVGLIEKPTGARDTMVCLQGNYTVAEKWRSMSDRLMPKGRYVLVPV